jgi:hypothetical protein
LVTIICLCYNQEDYVLQPIFALNDYLSIELIIVDDCSTDKSKSVIEKFASDFQIQFIANKINLEAQKSSIKPQKKPMENTLSIDLAADDILYYLFALPQIEAFKKQHFKTLGLYME